MSTTRQQLGDRGELEVSRRALCPGCGGAKRLKPLSQNFECADLICKFCGFLAQVKATTLAAEAEGFPSRIQGAGWRPKRDQIRAGIYHGLFLVGYSPKGKLVRIEYIPPHILQATPNLYVPRVIGPGAKRAGHAMFDYQLDELPPIGRFPIYPSGY